MRCWYRNERQQGGNRHRHQRGRQRQLQRFPDKGQLNGQTIAPVSQRAFSVRIGKQVGDVQRRQRLKHVIEKIGQRVPDSKEIKLGTILPAAK